MGSRPSNTGSRRDRALALLAGLAAACLALALLPVPASATVSYQSPQALSGPVAGDPQIAIDGSDRATIVWQRGSTARTESIRLAADGTPGPVQTLSAAGQGAANPQVAIDGSDRATITWQRSDGTNNRIQSVRLAADGTPGAVQTLSAAGQDAANPQVAIDGSDRATITWQRSDGTKNRIQSVRLAADGTPGAAQTLSAAGQNADNPQVAVDGSDRATISWWRNDGTNRRIQSIRLAAEGTPGAAQTISAAGQHAAHPQVAVDGGSGRATIAWRRSDGTNTRIQSVRLAADGTPGSVKTLSGAGLDADKPQVAIDGSDRSTITWEAGPLVASDSRIQVVRLAADGVPGAAQTLPEAGDGDPSDPQVAIDGSDRATVVWGGSVCCSTGIAESVRLAADGRPGPVQIVPATVGGFHSLTPDPQVAIDGSDRATITSPQQDGSTGAYHIESVRSEIAYPETTITSGPSGLTDNASPSFAFTDEVASTTFECSLDSETFAPCSSPKPYSKLADGPHDFAVRAVDVETDVDPTPAERSFTVDAITGFASAKQTQRQKGKKIVVKAKVGAGRAGEDLTAKATGTIRIGGRIYGFGPRFKRVAGGTSKTLKLRPNGGARRIAKELKQGKKAKARLFVKLSDEDGNTKKKKLSVKLKR